MDGRRPEAAALCARCLLERDRVDDLLHLLVEPGVRRVQQLRLEEEALSIDVNDPDLDGRGHERRPPATDRLVVPEVKLLGRACGVPGNTHDRALRVVTPHAALFRSGDLGAGDRRKGSRKIACRWTDGRALLLGAWI